MGLFLRHYITPLSLVLFAAVGVTGLMMYFGIRNHQLGELHEWFGIAFVVIAILHLIRNAGGFALMMSKARSLILIGALGAVAMLLIGSALTAPGGRGPHGGGRHAAVELRLNRASLAHVAPALGMTGEDALARLRAGGITVEGTHQSLDDIARANDAPQPRLYRLLLEP